MVRLSHSKVGSDLLLIYCSVVPHDFPPSHRVNFVWELSRHVSVIFVDLPSSLRLNPLSRAFKFYISLIYSFFRFEYPFVWEFFRFQRVHFLILHIYLLFQKYFLKKRIILYTTSGFYDSIYRYIPYEKSIFDCPDRHKDEFEKNKSWIQKFNLVFTNTKLLFESVNKYNNNVKIVASGYLDNRIPESFHHKILNSVLFSGGISQRIDYGLLEKVIRRLPQVQFYFVGEVYLNKYYIEPEDNHRLKKWRKILNYPNVHYLGNFSETVLQNILPLFGIGIIPYVTSDVFNYYSNPIKLYDYLAYGMSVISTPLPNVEIFTNSLPVYTARSPLEFVRKIEMVLRKSDRDIFKYKDKVARLLQSQNVERKKTQVLRAIKLLLME